MIILSLFLSYEISKIYYSGFFSEIFLGNQSNEKLCVVGLRQLVVQNKLLALNL